MRHVVPFMLLAALVCCDGEETGTPAPADSAPMCTDLAQQGDQVTPVVEISKDHAPATGGDIAEGIYVLTSSVVGEGSMATAPLAATLQIQGATMTEVISFGPGDDFRTVSSFSISGNTLTRDSLCAYVSQGAAVVNTNPYEFTATATQLTFSAAADGSTPYFAEVFVKR